MELISIRIENYKSIEDSNEYSAAPVTCLVGKNESGKTNILQAIYKLNPDIPELGNFIPLYDYPRRKLSEYLERHDTNPDNVLTTTWEITEDEINHINEHFGVNIFKNKKITICKGYNNQLNWSFNLNEKMFLSNCFELSGCHKEEIEVMDKLQTVSDIFNFLESKEELSPSFNRLLEHIRKIVPSKNLYQDVELLLEKYVPKFLYFADYYKLPGKISIDALIGRQSRKEITNEDRIFIALLNLIGTNLKEIQQIQTTEELIAKLEAVSTHMSDIIFKYWSQNKYLKVDFRFDHSRPQDPAPYNAGWIYQTRIMNNRHGVTLSIEDRSAGFIWFFSFLVWFSQVKRNYGENLIILLDDPGLSLHARAQYDLLKYINEQLIPNYQVIYTTHSPFMIDPEKLMRVRTVEDVIVDDEVLGTKISEDILTIDKDTIFPLQAALGYDITQTLFIGKHCLLVEGPSDLLYLRWASQQLEDLNRTSLDSRWTITPCGGIDKIASFVALFGANALDIACLTDYSTGKKNKVNALKRSEILKAGHAFSVDEYVDGFEADIEDMLGREFYITLVNECYSLEGINKITDKKPKKGSIRILQVVEDQFTEINSNHEFNHYKPSLYLIENFDAIKDKIPNIEGTLDRFKGFFKDVNALLPDV